MKKFKYIIAGLLAIYVTIALALFLFWRTGQKQNQVAQRVEINRLVQDLGTCQQIKQADHAIVNIDLSRYSYVNQVKQVYFLPHFSGEKEKLQQFYQYSNSCLSEYQPLYIRNVFRGYLRFDYVPQKAKQTVFVLCEMGLLLLTVCMLAVLIYIKNNIISPFHKFSEMPYELSRGHLQGSVKESKNRYFGRFLWGIGMLQDTLATQKQRELSLARDKKMILLSISHDIKTPLNAINLYAKAVEQGLYETRQEQMDAMKKIQEKTREINGFVHEIMESSTKDILSIPVEVEEFYLDELAQKVKEGYGERCSLRQVDFTVGKFENHLLKGDKERLYEAIGNLVENGLKYGDGHKIEITFDEEDYCQLIHVYNTGEAVAEEEIPHLMESFYRGSNAESKQGNGLGLYICSEIMKKMGGEIYVQKEAGGMEFVLVCPIC